MESSHIVRKPFRPSQLKNLFAAQTFKVYVALNKEDAAESDVDTIIYLLGKKIAGELYTRSDMVTYRIVETVNRETIFEVTYERFALGI